MLKASLMCTIGAGIFQTELFKETSLFLEFLFGLVSALYSSNQHNFICQD